MNQRTILLAGISIAGLGVIIGAFGAHALKETLDQTGKVETFELAVRYQFYHALAMIAAGILIERFNSKRISQAALMFCLGILFFSGSLYILSLTGINKLGAVTPIGGLFFIAGWLMLFLGVFRK